MMELMKAMDECDAGHQPSGEPFVCQDIEIAALEIVEKLVDDVILSNNRQPSICGIVLDVIMFAINNPTVRSL